MQHDPFHRDRVGLAPPVYWSEGTAHTPPSIMAYLFGYPLPIYLLVMPTALSSPEMERQNGSKLPEAIVG